MSKSRAVSPQIIALSGLLAAVTLVLLYLASIIPSGWAGVTAVAGLAVAIAVSAAGFYCGAMTYVVSALLSLLLIPAKQVALLFVCLFGLYPLLKQPIERVRLRVAEYLLKLVFFNVVLVIVYHAFFALFFSAVTWEHQIPLLLVVAVVGSVIFLLYDFAFSKVMSMLQARLVPQLRKRIRGR